MCVAQLWRKTWALMRERSIPTVSARLSMMRSTPWRLNAPPRAFRNSRESFRASGKAPRPSAPEIVAKRDLQGRAHGHETLLEPFAGHENQLLVEVEVPEADADDFGHASAGAVEEFEQGAVSEVNRRERGNGVDAV